MSLFNKTIKEINIKELLFVIISIYLVWYYLNSFVIPISSNWASVAFIFYFIIKLRNESIKNEISTIFSRISFKYILLIVILNVLFSYGMLYFSDFILNFPSVKFLMGVMSLNIVGGYVAIILISPIYEELLFRAVLLNKLMHIVPPIFAIVISSLLFGAFHSFGNIFSGFIFAMCMAILYLKTENIFVPILAHFLNNVIAETIVVMDVNKILFNNEFIVGVMSVLAIISFVLIVISIIRELNNFK